MKIVIVQNAETKVAFRSGQVSFKGNIAGMGGVRYNNGDGKGVDGVARNKES